jgi:CheY-like chemotaxis protein
LGAEGLLVLLVDADAERAALVSAGLQAAGYEVVALAPDAADLTRRVRESRAEVIVCDLDDPGRDALESMRALNRDEPRPVVLFAERGEAEQIEAAPGSGATAIPSPSPSAWPRKPGWTRMARRSRPRPWRRWCAGVRLRAGRPCGWRRCSPSPRIITCCGTGSPRAGWIRIATCG